MSTLRRPTFKTYWRAGLRRGIAALPRAARLGLYRRFVECDPSPDPRLVLKIAETRDELEACFRLLHDAYVSSGFMQPDPSGMRVTIYHALPTTTTLCAIYDGRVVGTLSMIREGIFGFPMQSIFDLEPVREREGQLAEISALAVHPDFRRSGGAVLFPLMKFMYEYATQYFDTRHLLIAVNPDRIELYEALLLFERLKENTVDAYDFANGAPAVGATLDLKHALGSFRRVYGSKPLRKNLYKYFSVVQLPNIQKPHRRYFTTNDPVMSPALLDYFFNQKTQTFAELDDRRKALLWSIYTMAEYRRVLPMLDDARGVALPVLRQHLRYTIACPGEVTFHGEAAEVDRMYVMRVVEISQGGFKAECSLDIPLEQPGVARIDLGHAEQSHVFVRAVRRIEAEWGHYYGFMLLEADAAWRECVAALEVGHTSHDLLAV